MALSEATEEFPEEAVNFHQHADGFWGNVTCSLAYITTFTNKIAPVDSEGRPSWLLHFSQAPPTRHQFYAFCCLAIYGRSA